MKRSVLPGKANLFFLFFAFFSCVFSQRSFAADEDSTSTSDSLSKKPSTKVFIAAPTLTYAPETRFAGGVYALYYFRLSKNRNDTRASSVDLSLKYTQNKQIIIEPTWKIFSKKDKYAVMGSGIYQDFREYFYGIGNNALKEQEELYSYNLWKFESKFQRRTFERLFIGPYYHFQQMKDVRPKAGGQLDTSHITGTEGGVASGLGLSLTLDYRNSVLTPTKGYYLDLSNINFIPAFGSDFTFSSYTFDARKYFKLRKKDIFAVQGFFQHLSGNPPFRMLAMVGGPQLMRGYYFGRYRDRNYVAAQAEYRLPLFWRIGITGFASAGEVAYQLKDLNFDGLHFAYGMGFRFLVNRKENLNFRIDVGLGGDTPAVYATVGEAF